MINASIFFDTDCISAFLWVNEESLLPKLYPNRIVIPQKVYDELSNPAIPHLKRRVDSLIKSEQVSIEPILVGTEEFDMYSQFVCKPEKGMKIIGEGEAASLAMAIKARGKIASNNLSDIMPYVNKYGVSYITTGDILVNALDKNLINLEEGEKIWKEMIAKRRKLGANSFTEYIKKQ